MRPEGSAAAQCISLGAGAGPSGLSCRQAPWPPQPGVPQQSAPLACPRKDDLQRSSLAVCLSARSQQQLDGRDMLALRVQHCLASHGCKVTSLLGQCTELV